MPGPDIWAEVWERPGHPTYGKVIASPPIQVGSVTVGYSGVGAGSMTLPHNYSRMDDILYTDPSTPTNGKWSTIRVFSSQGWLYDWLPSPLVPPQNKADPGTEITGFGIEGIMDFYRTEPWDWNGDAEFASTFPDWIYGGRNLLNNPGFETSVCRPEVEAITITATSGSFFLQLGADSTSSLDVTTLTAFLLETELEAFTTAIDDVLVTGTGTEDDPYVIEAVTPCTWDDAPLIVIEDPGDPWVGGTVDLTRVQFGALQPNPWTKSQVVSSGTPRVFGEYTSFRVTTAQAHSGTFSLLIDPAPIGRRYAGAQQIIQTKIGGRYQASVWVYTASAGQTYRLVIRGIDEDIMQDVNGDVALVQVTPSANTWTQLSIPDVIAEDTQLIFRIANINVSGNPAIFYVDDGEFNEGMAAATVGLMMREHYEDATVDHVADGRFVWENEAVPGTSYITLDFSDTLDSGGVPWADAALSLTFKPRMTGLHILAQFVRLGYEWRVVPDDIPTGTYLLQIYNPGTLGEVQPVAIQGGAFDIRRDARYFSPQQTSVMVQGAANLYAHADDAALQTPFGRIEGSLLDQNITSLTDAALAAQDGVEESNIGAESLVYTLRPLGGYEPLIAFRPGDEIEIVDLPRINDVRRVSQIILAWDKTGPEYTVSLGSVALVGQMAVNQSVDDLIKAFRRAQFEAEPVAVSVGGGGGVPRVVIAAADASAQSMAKADISGGDDPGMLALADTSIGGEIRLTEGTYLFGSTTWGPGAVLSGAGWHSTQVVIAGDWTIEGNVTFRDFGGGGGG